MLARHLMARYLYVLAMLVTDEGYFLDSTTGASNVQWFTEIGLNAQQKRELAVRRLAQWAVNVVDFMDSDNIMTPFEYDAYPFSNTDPTTGNLKVPGNPGITWAVDGIVDDGSGQLSQDDTKPWRRLVWGCENQPALLMESWAIHNRNVADTDFDDGVKKRRDQDNDGTTKLTAPGQEDPTLDQTRIPQGSAFFEIYATHNAHAPIQSGDLYDYNAATQTWFLNLGKLAPPSSDGSTPSYPVWRMVISESHVSNANNDVFARITAHPDTASFEPEQYRGAAATPAVGPAPTGAFSLMPANVAGLAVPGEAANVQIDRIIWLAQLRPSSQHLDNDRIYFNRSGNAELGPGQYAIVGPRSKTIVGSDATAAGTQKWGNPSKMIFSLSPTVSFTSASGAPLIPAVGVNIQAPLGIVVAGSIPNNVMDPTTGAAAPWTSAGQPRSTNFPEGIGISISEPLYSASNYYPEPKEKNTAASTLLGTNVIDAYGDLSETDSTKLFRDDPLDSRGVMPLKKDNILPTGTTSAYKHVFLQRLANPLAPYNPLSNPYLTIDWMPIDLTVFNGEDSFDKEKTAMHTGLPENQWDPDDSTPSTTANTNIHFGTRERIDYTPGAQIVQPPLAGTNQTFNIWTQASAFSDTTTRNAALTSIFKYDLTPSTTSLGFLNHSYGAPWKTGDMPAPPNASYIGAAFAAPGGVGPGAPQPFPWLTWNNRPYTSPAELMLVPASSPGRFMHEFALPVNNNKPYDDGASVINQRAPFSHLLNFFSSSKTTNKTPNLANILEYVQVQSPFVGTETVLSPTKFAWDFTAGGAEPVGTEGLHPPFNMVSNYRDPGKVNINTINGSPVWNTALGGAPEQFFDAWAAIRHRWN